MLELSFLLKIINLLLFLQIFEIILNYKLILELILIL